MVERRTDEDCRGEEAPFAGRAVPPHRQGRRVPEEPWLLRKCNDTVTIACAAFEIISRGEQLTQAKGEYETGTGKERAQERDRRLSAERDVAVGGAG